MNQFRFEGNMSKRIVYGVFVLGALSLAFAEPPAKDVAPVRVAAGARTIALNSTHLVAGGFQISAFLETGSDSEVCIATYNRSNQPEELAPILCDATEYHGKRGIRLVSYLGAHPNDNFAVTISVYQEDAQFYGAPVRYDARKQQ
jgi:hypothetical protein